MGAFQDDDDSLANRSGDDLRSFQNEIDILEILEHDDRPIVVVTENSHVGNKSTKKIIFSNSAFQQIQAQIESSEKLDGNSHNGYLSAEEWIGTLTGCKSQRSSWRNHAWRVSTTGRWQIIRGSGEVAKQNDISEVAIGGQANGTLHIENSGGK